MRFKEIFFFFTVQIGLAYSLLCYQCENCKLNQTNTQIFNCHGQICYLGTKDGFYFQGCLKSDEIDRVIRFYESNKICDFEFCNKNYDSLGQIKNWSSTLSNHFYLWIFIALLQFLIYIK